MKTISTKVATFLFVLMGLFFYQTAQSQILISLLLGDKLNSDKLEFGIEGGLNRSYLSGIDEAKGSNNFFLGFYFDFKLKNNLYLNTGLRVKSNMGATNLDIYKLGDEDLDSVMVNGHISRRIRYFNLPLHIKYRFAKQFYVQGGFQLGLMYKAEDLFYNSVKKKDDVIFTHDITDHVKRIDAGLSGGLGYKFKGTGMNFGVTYYYGLTNISKEDNITSKNSTFYVYVCIPIGAGKKEDKEP